MATSSTAHSRTTQRTLHESPLVDELAHHSPTSFHALKGLFCKVRDHRLNHVSSLANNSLALNGFAI